MGNRVLVTDNQSHVLQEVTEGVWDAALFVSIEGCSILYITSHVAIENLQAAKESYSFLKKHGEVYVFSTEEAELRVVSRLRKFLPEIIVEPQFSSSKGDDANDGYHTDIGML